MRCMTIRVGPGLSSIEQGTLSRQVPGRDQSLQRRQPIFVVARTVVGLSAIGGRLEFFGKRGGPFLPGEIALLGEFHCEGKCLCLPWFGKYRALLVPRHS